MNQTFRVGYCLKAGSVLLGCLLFAQACSSSKSAEAELPNKRRPDANALQTYLDLPASADELLMVELTREEAVRACMLKQGFEYTPFAEPAAAPYAPIGGLMPGSREFYETYGFGHSTTLFPASELPADVIGLPDTESVRVVEDPNAFYRAQLSEPEATKYSQVLSGKLASGKPSKSGDCSDLSADGFVLDEPTIQEVVSSYERTLADLVAPSEPWKSYIMEIKTCLSLADLGVVARSLDGMLRDPLTGQQISESVERAVGGSLGRDLASHQGDDFESLRESQRYEMAVASAAVACGWPDHEASYLEIAAPFEAQVWASLQPAIEDAKRKLDAAEWSLSGA